MKARGRHFAQPLFIIFLAAFLSAYFRPLPYHPAFMSFHFSVFRDTADERKRDADVLSFAFFAQRCRCRAMPSSSFADADIRYARQPYCRRHCHRLRFSAPPIARLAFVAIVRQVSYLLRQLLTPPPRRCRMQQQRAAEQRAFAIWHTALLVCPPTPGSRLFAVSPPTPSRRDIRRPPSIWSAADVAEDAARLPTIRSLFLRLPPHA